MTKVEVKKIDTNTVEIKGVRYTKEDSFKWLDVSDVLGKGFEVEIEVHDKNKSWDELGLKYGDKRLLTAEQVSKLANSKHAKVLKMDGSSSEDDFFIDQPYKLNKKKGLVAYFYAYSGGLDLGAYGGSVYADLGRGVRFVRKVKKS